jgi:preprotein translocase subunit SecA
MRGIDTCIVDEADSVLIDEAVTPLIISAPRKNELLERAVVAARDIIESLQAGGDYQVNLRYREIELSKDGRTKLAAACSNLEGLWRGTQRRDELILQALVSREFFLRDRHYIIVDGKIVIVDEATGRQMPQRTWRQGLHQAIEAKERLEMTAPAETIARLSFQRFFRCFRKLSGMTGTGKEAAAEFWHVYRLAVVTIPSNRPCIRRHLPDRVFPTETAKWEAIADEIQAQHSTGRPILVGTRSVEASEQLARQLAQRNLAFTVLNAVRHREEASVVALAGELGQITVATNMAGRGTDIKLGDGVAALGGLHVIATERHESGRVDRQFFGRAGRQGDPGSAQAFLCLEDELLRRYLPAVGRWTFGRTIRARPQNWPGLARIIFRWAQTKAQKEAAKQRQEVLRVDTWLEESLSFSDSNKI